ncbi:MAG: signal peptidase I [Planctomycetes bacterium]|nr:signal peptidase I [Planctomycetota bacterium]
MRGVLDVRLEEAMLRRLDAGPAAFEALAAAARAAAPADLARAEGALHALLLRLVRAGRVEVAGRAPSGSAVYAKAGAPPEAPSADPAAIPPPVPASASRVALDVASRVRDPEERGRVVADVLAHRAELAAAGRARAFGPTKAARDALRHVAAGRPTICVPASPWERLQRFLRHEGPSALVTGVALVLAYVFVAEFRVVPTHSMEPGIRPGDRLLVWKLGAHDVPSRFDIVVFRDRGGTPLVKRACGLPGESVALEDGDLYVDGALVRKPDAVSAAAREPLLRVPFDGAPPEGWAPADAAGFVRLARPLYADEPGYRDEAGRVEAHAIPRPLAHDVYLDARAGRGAALSLTVAPRGAALAAGATFVLERDADGATRLRRTGAGAPPDSGLASGRDGGEGEATLSLSLVDGVVRAVAPGLAFEGEVGRLPGVAEIAVRGRVATLAVDRDLHWTQPTDAQYAVANPYRVPDGHVFFLGDHSSGSRDSRYAAVGPVPLDRLLGRVVFRVWPIPRVGVPR